MKHYLCAAALGGLPLIKVRKIAWVSYGTPAARLRGRVEHENEKATASQDWRLSAVEYSNLVGYSRMALPGMLW